MSFLISFSYQVFISEFSGFCSTSCRSPCTSLTESWMVNLRGRSFSPLRPVSSLMAFDCQLLVSRLWTQGILEGE